MMYHVLGAQLTGPLFHRQTWIPIQQHAACFLFFLRIIEARMHFWIALVFEGKEVKKSVTIVDA